MYRVIYTGILTALASLIFRTRHLALVMNRSHSVRNKYCDGYIGDGELKKKKRKPTCRSQVGMSWVPHIRRDAD